MKSETNRAAILADYYRGLSLRAVGARHGLSHMGVKKVLQRAGAHARNCRPTHRLAGIEVAGVTANSNDIVTVEARIRFVGRRSDQPREMVINMTTTGPSVAEALRRAEQEAAETITALTYIPRRSA